MRCILRMTKRLWETSQSFPLLSKITGLRLLHLHCHCLRSHLLCWVGSKGETSERVEGEMAVSGWICGYCLALPAIPYSPLSPQTVAFQMGVQGEDIHSPMRDWHHEGNQGSYFLAAELPHTLKSRENNLEHIFKVQNKGQIYITSLHGQLYSEVHL